MPVLDAKIPEGPLEEKWSNYKFKSKLVNPTNRRKHTIIVVGTGLAGSAAAATLAEQGYQVKAFTMHDSPRRAHSIAAQGGINAAKNYCNDGDSVHRLFYDTIKGGDFRSREANVHRLAEISANIIDQCVAQGVPFAREYSGYLENRSFGGTQVSRTFYAKGQTGQQLLLGAYSALMKEVDNGNVTLYTRREMVDLVVIDGIARGIIVRNEITGKIESYAADAVLLATGGYTNVFFLSTNAMGCNVTAAWRAHKKGALFANPCYTQIHPTCIPVHGDYQSKLTLMSESLRNDGRVWVPKVKGDRRPPHLIPEAERDYFLERKYPSFGNLVPRDLASRNVKEQCDQGKGLGSTGFAVCLDFSEYIKRIGADVIRSRYENLFEMLDDFFYNNVPEIIHQYVEEINLILNEDRLDDLSDIYYGILDEIKSNNNVVILTGRLNELENNNIDILSSLDSINYSISKKPNPSYGELNILITKKIKLLEIFKNTNNEIYTIKSSLQYISFDYTIDTFNIEEINFNLSIIQNYFKNEHKIDVTFNDLIMLISNCPNSSIKTDMDILEILSTFTWHT